MAEKTILSTIIRGLPHIYKHFDRVCTACHQNLTINTDPRLLREVGDLELVLKIQALKPKA